MMIKEKTGICDDILIPGLEDEVDDGGFHNLRDSRGRADLGVEWIYNLRYIEFEVPVAHVNGEVL